MKLFVGCCNKKTGLWLVDPKTGATTKLNDADVRGTAYVDGALYYLTKRGLWLYTPDQDVCITPIENDWHGLTYHAGRLWGVDPVSDTLVEFELSGKFIARWHWKRDPKAGRFHTNDIDIKDVIWQCCFTEGICRDGVPTGFGKGLQPHSVKVHRGRVYYCASNVGEVRTFMIGAKTEETIFSAPEGFTRGLCPTTDGLWIGLSEKRHGTGGTGAVLAFVPWGCTEPALEFSLEANEVYSITVAP